MAVLQQSSSVGDVSLYLVRLYSGEDLQWPFKVFGQKATPVALAYHDEATDYEGLW